MNSNKKCPICGEPTSCYMGNYRKDGLCKIHANEYKNGNIWYDEEKDEWINKEEIKSTKYDTCIICGNNADGWKYLCSNCYNNVLAYVIELDKNMSLYQFKDYYFNLKTNISRMTGFEKFIKPNCQKLIAIAKANSRYNNNEELLNRIEKDIKEIVEKKKNKDFLKEEIKVIEHNEKVQKKEFRSQDGHFLDSQIEVQIDDLLWQKNIVHAVHYPVFDITERNVYCDWYIPVMSNKGIYIELWGMDKKDYIDNKNEKIELYNKHKLKLIEFDRKSLNDTLDITRELMNKIKIYSKELKEEN